MGDGPPEQFGQRVYSGRLLARRCEQTLEALLGRLVGVEGSCTSEVFGVLALEEDSGLPKEPVEVSIRVSRTANLKRLLLTLDELYTVAVRILYKEDTGAAAHSVRLALEVHATHLF